jgi:uncharacterized coiled-coil DUF342 family protein
VTKKEVDKLRAEQNRLCEDKLKLQRELERVQGDLESKGAQERLLTEQLQSFKRQLTEKISAAEELQSQCDEWRAQLDSTQLDKKLVKIKWCTYMQAFYQLHLPAYNSLTPLAMR